MERKRITIEELLERYAAGERDFSEVRISYDIREGEFGPAIREFDGISTHTCQMEVLEVIKVSLC